MKGTLHAAWLAPNRAAAAEHQRCSGGAVAEACVPEGARASGLGHKQFTFRGTGSGRWTGCGVLLWSAGAGAGAGAGRWC